MLVAAAVYLAALAWVDRDGRIVQQLGALWGVLAVAVVPVAASYVVRYQRWRALLASRGHGFGWWRGFTAYLAGFAFTASPGKAGELIRVRYFAAAGVPAPHTFAAFVFERALDVLALLALSLVVAGDVGGFGLLLWCAAGFVCALFALARNRTAMRWMAELGDRLPARWLRTVVGVATGGLAAMSSHVRGPTVARGLLLGLVAWGVNALAFASLCVALSLELPPHALLGIDPLAMLVGALSFVPGGIGTTELAIVLLLRHYGVGDADAITVAVGSRLATLWFAVLVGMVAMSLSEARLARMQAR